MLSLRLHNLWRLTPLILVLDLDQIAMVRRKERKERKVHIRESEASVVRSRENDEGRVGREVTKEEVGVVVEVNVEEVGVKIGEVVVGVEEVEVEEGAVIVIVAEVVNIEKNVLLRHLKKPLQRKESKTSKHHQGLLILYHVLKLCLVFFHYLFVLI